MQEHEETDYSPSECEAYMNDRQLNYFRQQLLAQQDELTTLVRTSRVRLRNLQVKTPDLVDQSLNESDIAMELKDSERRRNKLLLIRRALERIDEGSFGYCAVTGSRIGLKRLKAQPFATMSVEAQEIIEEASRSHYQRSGQQTGWAGRIAMEGR